jgi:hypothetical protein
LDLAQIATFSSAQSRLELCFVDFLNRRRAGAPHQFNADEKQSLHSYVILRADGFLKAFSTSPSLNGIEHRSSIGHADHLATVTIHALRIEF